MEKKLNNFVLRQRRRGEKGFTLIELLVVIAVLGILAAIVLFNVVGVTNRGKGSACNTDVRTIQAAVDADINDGALGNSGTLVAGPMNPATGTNDLTVLSTGGFLHEGATPTTACNSSLTLTFTAAGDITKGATVAGTP
jgi:prepilin-type N-terminal cleavage/methylation domain-containing protein